LTNTVTESLGCTAVFLYLSVCLLVTGSEWKLNLWRQNQRIKDWRQRLQK